VYCPVNIYVSVYVFIASLLVNKRYIYIWQYRRGIAWRQIRWLSVTFRLVVIDVCKWRQGLGLAVGLQCVFVNQWKDTRLGWGGTGICHHNSRELSIRAACSQFHSRNAWLMIRLVINKFPNNGDTIIADFRKKPVVCSIHLSLQMKH
jgi:hypothetical protein